MSSVKVIRNYLYILFVALFAVSCGSKTTVDPKFDDSLYEQLDKGFYKGKKDGKLYIKTGPLVDTVEKDKSIQLVYFYSQVPDIDVSTYARLQHSGYYAKDKNRVYIWEFVPNQGETAFVLQGADPATFQAIGYRWGKDTNTVFYENKPLKGLNPFEATPVCAEELDSSLIYIDFIRDNDQLFYKNQPIKVPETIDITKIYCKTDLLGNSFLAVGEQLYIIRNNTMVPY